MKQLIWTAAYTPFMMGGDVHSPISTEIEIGESFDIGKEMRAYLVVSPSGKTHIAEAETGGFVGTDIEQVKKDVKNAKQEVVEEQIEWAKKEVKKAIRLDNEEFWARFKDERTV